MPGQVAGRAASLESVWFYSRLPREDLDRLHAVTSFGSYAPGETVFREGDPPHSLFVVTRGQIKVIKTKPTGREVILAVFAAGDPLGAACLFEKRPYPATAIALRESECAETPRAEFLRILATSPSMTEAVMAAMSRRLVQFTRRLTEVSGLTVERRLARIFVGLADGCGRADGDETLIPVRLTRSDLADLAGTTLETCSRVMSNWRRREVLVDGERCFVLRDRQYLDRLSGGG